MHTGNALAEELKAHDVRHVFGVPGEQTLALYDALSEDESIEHIVMRDERNLPYAGAAYSRVTGKVGVIDATVGPGVAMLPLGLLEAMRSTTPLLTIASDVPVDYQPMSDNGAISQGMDQLAFLDPVTKWRSKAWRQDQVIRLARRALQEATSGVPGPTAVIIPQDVFNEEDAEAPDPNSMLRGAYGSYPPYRPVPDSATLSAAMHVILQAKRPILVAGGGVLHSGAEEQLLALAERLSIPVATTLTGKGSIREDHSLSLGVLGDLGTLAAKNAAEAADLIVHVGFRSGQNSTFKWTLPSPEQQAIHIDIDPRQPGQYLHCDVPLVGDAAATIEALLEIAQRRGEIQRTLWLEQVSTWKAEWNKQVDQEVTSDSIPVLPQRVVDEITQASNPQDVLVSDASFSSGWAAIYYRIREAGRRIILPRGMAGLGFGLPAAIGAKAALPDQTVFMLAGDGGFAYSLGELITLKEYGLKVISVVLNNRSWGWMEFAAKATFDKEYFSLPDVPFAKVAEAMGLNGIRISRPSDLSSALQDAVHSPESSVIEVDSAVWEAPLQSYRDIVERQRGALAGALS
jgi:acetolactate synthase I/II/III large subunit